MNAMQITDLNNGNYSHDDLENLTIATNGTTSDYSYMLDGVDDLQASVEDYVTGYIKNMISSENHSDFTDEEIFQALVDNGEVADAIRYVNEHHPLGEYRETLEAVTTAPEAAARYGLHEDTVRKACSQGRIPHRRAGNVLLIPSEAAANMWGNELPEFDPEKWGGLSDDELLEYGSADALYKAANGIYPVDRSSVERWWNEHAS